MTRKPLPEKELKDLIAFLLAASEKGGGAVRTPLRDARIGKRFLDCAGRMLAGARGKKNCRPAPLEMTVLGTAEIVRCL